MSPDNTPGRSKTRRIALFILRLLFAVIFISSGMAKVFNLEGFAKAIYGYNFIPVPPSNFVAVTLPWIELVCGFFLLFGLMIPECLTAGLGMLVVFTVLVGIAAARGYDNDCGCQALFMAQTVGARKIIENLVLIGMGLALLFSLKPKIPATVKSHQDERR